MKRPSSEHRRTAGRSALAAALAVLSLSGCGGRGATGAPAPRVVDPLLPVERDLNVIVVSFDALRPDALGIYGSPRGATPNIDAFAADSFVFENAYSVAPATPTSFSASWSGFLPTRVFHAWRLRARATLASRLADAGYRTHAIVNNVQLTPERGFDHGFACYDWRRNDPDDAVLESAMAWLDENGARPFFLWVHFLTPHAPYDELPGAVHLYRQPGAGRFAHTSGHEFEASSPEDLKRLQDLYMGEVWSADRTFGALVDRLRELGLLDSSIVVLTTDHGEEFGEHGEFQHGRLYEEHLRVPLVVRHPGAAGGRVAARVRSVDLLPTLLDAVGRPVDEALDGVVVQVPAVHRPRPVVAVAMTGIDERWISLLTGSKKLILNCGPERGAEMYDLSTDPAEQRDLAGEDPRGVRDLVHRLGSIVGGDPCAVMARAVQGWAATAGLDEESVEVLRSLGYLD